MRLEELLCTVLDVGAMHRWASEHVPARELPPPAVAPVEYAGLVAEKLRHRGMVNATLFRSLRSLRPGQIEIIDRCERAELRPRPRGRGRLSVHLARRGRNVHQSWFVPSGRFSEGSVEAPAGLRAEDLRLLLLGDRPAALLRELFADPTAEAWTDGDADVFIHTSDPTLLAAPWHLLSALESGAPSGWTVVISGKSLPDRLVHLRAPCAVDLSTPDDALEQGLRARLDAAWPTHHDDRHVRRLAPGERGRSRVVIAAGAGAGLPPGTDEAALVVVASWGEPPTPDPLAGHLPPGQVRVAHFGSILEMRGFVAQFVGDILGRSGSDPVTRALELRARVASTVQRWEVAVDDAAPRRSRARATLDRVRQRPHLYQACSDLSRSPDRRVTALIVEGERGNLLSGFLAQVRDHVDREKPSGWTLARADNLGLPPRPLTPEKLDEHLEKVFALQEESAAVAFARRRRKGEKRTILVLDFGVLGPDPPPDLSAADIRRFLEWCATRLVRDCPRDMRLLPFLGIEGAAALDLRGVVAEFLERDHPGFDVADIEPLGEVHRRDLLVFLRSSDASCPVDRAVEATDLVLAAASGRPAAQKAPFDRVVELCERGEDIAWSNLCEELRARLGVPT